MPHKHTGSGTNAVVTVTGQGTAAATLTVSATGDAGANCSLDLNAAATDTIGGVCDTINAKSGFTCGLISVSGATCTSARALACDLAQVPSVSIQNTTATLSRNNAQFFADEIVAPKTMIQANLSAPTGFSPGISLLLPLY